MGQLPPAALARAAFPQRTLNCAWAWASDLRPPASALDRQLVDHLADIITIIYAFYFPRLFLIPIVMQFASLLSYAPYLLNTEVLQLLYVAVAVLGLILIAGAAFIQRTSNSQAHAAAPA
ncbi:MAG TPA: hypothetical protein VGD69_19790 [Herpetosiphonaceae bacterium]